MSLFVPDNVRAGLYAANHDDFIAVKEMKLYGQGIESVLEQGYIEEPTPTQFQEAHKRWRRILEERNEKIKELETRLEELSEGTVLYKTHLNVIKELELKISKLLDNSYSKELKEEVDKLRMSNQEKDIEIQELRDQVTKQAQRWLVPNFK